MNQIRYIGYDSSHGPDFSLCRPDGFDSWLLVFTRTAGLFQTDGEMTEYSPGCAVLFSPGSYINYKACGATYSDDWIRFESDESFVHTLPILNVPFQVQDREYIHGLIKLMTW